MENITLQVGGMTCGGCANGVKQALKKVTGVASVNVSLQENNATISFDPNQTNIATLKEAIENAGFDAE